VPALFHFASTGAGPNPAAAATSALPDSIRHAKTALQNREVCELPILVLFVAATMAAAVTPSLLIVLWALIVAIVATPLLLRRYGRNRRGRERAKLAAGRGWRFAADDPALLTRWRGDPFDRRGDKRRAFGVVHGVAHGMPFTAFDYRRRETKVMNAPDEYETVTVWALRLPASLPGVRVLREREGLRRQLQQKLGARDPRLPTDDAEFDRRFAVTGARPEFVRDLFTPELTGWLREQKISNWRIEGWDLLHVREQQFGRTKPVELVGTAERLADLIAHFPESVWQRYGRPDIPV
jgi:hypothetical protein